MLLIIQELQDSSSPCLGKSDLSRLVSESSTTATVKAVSSLAAAFRLVQIERCSKGVHCLPALRHDLHKGGRQFSFMSSELIFLLGITICTTGLPI